MGPDNAYLQIGDLVRKSDDLVALVYSTYLITIDMSWQLHYYYAVSPAQTLLQTDDTITVVGTYSTYPGIWGYPEILPTAIYFGGSTYGAMSLSQRSAASVMSQERSDGPFKPWPGPTAEEILASDRFREADSHVGAIGWALSQPDGAVIDLPSEAVCGEWYDGRVIGLREWFEPIPNGPRLFLYLDKPENTNGFRLDMSTIDIIGGTLVTLSDGRRAIMMPKAVYLYTDQKGRVSFPVPWLKNPARGDNRPVAEWPWKALIAP